MIKISIIALGTKMPQWVEMATSDYLKRIQEYANVNLIEIPLEKRAKSGSNDKQRQKEADKVIQSLPKSAKIIALEIEGKSYTSTALSEHLEQISIQHSHLCFIIGGPEGIHQDVLKACDAKWSLSELTLPHPLVRVLLIETLYRAFSIRANHPYHK